MPEKREKVAIIGIRGIPANYGGFETCAEETAVRLTKSFEVRVFCRNHNSSFEGDIYKNVNLTKLPSVNTKSLDTISHTFLCALYLLFQPTVKIIHLYNTANAIFIPLLKLFQKKVVISVDGLEWKRLKWGVFARHYFRIAEFLSAKFAHKVVADSRVIKKYYLQKFGVNTEYIPYGADLDGETVSSIFEKYQLKPREYLLFVGRLVPEKGVHNLIKAYNNLATNMPLVIIGDDAVYKDYIANLKKIADPKVLFMGFRYGKEYRTLNKYAYFYVSASLLEGTSPALVNAMGAGNCVLVNGISENLETIGDAGFSFKENDIKDLQRKMIFLLKSPDVVEVYRKKAYAHVQSIYNWDKITQKYAGLFNNLLLESR